MMLDRKVSIAVNEKTFPGKKAPAFLTNAAAFDNSISVGSALLMLGSLTVPGGFTSASPARFWAWLRYLTAITKGPHLQIASPFVDLDPHQRGILSDDFGVAITTRWLHEAFGGFANVVDGRRFVLQYAALLKQKPRGKLAKVGATKCPDFVLCDAVGSWHVLECKGTQTGVSYMKQQLKTARIQKLCIDIAGPHKGYRLAAGLYLGNENNGDSSVMQIDDPEPEAEPLITIGADKRRAQNVMRRLAISRAFAMSGAFEMAEEVALPQGIVEDEAINQLYFEREKARFSVPRDQRIASAVAGLGKEPAGVFEVAGREYEGRTIEIAIPDQSLRDETGAARIRIRQGTSREVLGSARKIATGNIVSRMDKFLSNEDAVGQGGIQISETFGRVIIKDGNLAVATLEFLG